MQLAGDAGNSNQWTFIIYIYTWDFMYLLVYLYSGMGDSGYNCLSMSYHLKLS